jgi:hypothetical protein
MHCTLPRFSRTALNIVAASDLHSQERDSEIRFSTTQSGQRQIGAESAMIAINATLAQKTFAIRRMTILMALEQMFCPPLIPRCRSAGWRWIKFGH